MQTIKVKITGTAPLMCHSGALANPLNPLVKEIKTITNKRKKTDEDHERLCWLEFKAGLYYNEDLGPYIPGMNLASHLRDAAKHVKRGKDVARALLVIEDKIPIEYSGPRDPEKMYAAGKFVDVRAVKVGTSRCMRTRSIFPEWSLTFTLAFNPEIFNESDVMEFLRIGGELVGFNESRPYYGKYSASMVNGKNGKH